MTRSERFKAARTLLNQHGEQTVRQVAEAVGVAPSMVSDLENSTFDRNITYQNAAAFARHYGVDVVWLMEGDDAQDHKTPPLAVATEYTDLSAAAVEQLRRLARRNLSPVASAVIADEHFESLLVGILYAVDATVKADAAAMKPQIGNKSEIAEQVVQASNGKMSVIDTEYLPATYQYLAEYHLSQLIAELSHAAKKPLSPDQIAAEAKAFAASVDPYARYDKGEQSRAEIHKMVDDLNK